MIHEVRLQEWLWQQVWNKFTNGVHGNTRKYNYELEWVSYSFEPHKGNWHVRMWGINETKHELKKLGDLLNCLEKHQKNFKGDYQFYNNIDHYYNHINDWIMDLEHKMEELDIDNIVRHDHYREMWVKPYAV